MRTQEDILNAIQKVEGLICETKLKLVQYESWHDSHMWRLYHNRLIQYLAQRNTMKWFIE